MPAVEMLEEQVEEQVKYENVPINNAYFTVDVLFLLIIHNNLYKRTLKVSYSCS